MLLATIKYIKINWEEFVNCLFQWQICHTTKRLRTQYAPQLCKHTINETRLIIQLYLTLPLSNVLVIKCKRNDAIDCIAEQITYFFPSQCSRWLSVWPTNACRLKYRCWSEAETLVTCENWQGCDICDFCGNGAGFGRFCCLRLRPGTLNDIFSGLLINRSIATQISCAASFESKLNPMTLVWSMKLRKVEKSNFSDF